MELPWSCLGVDMELPWRFIRPWSCPGVALEVHGVAMELPGVAWSCHAAAAQAMAPHDTMQLDPLVRILSKFAHQREKDHEGDDDSPWHLGDEISGWSRETAFQLRQAVRAPPDPRKTKTTCVCVCVCTY